jgi:enamine deaminase RidA (YjgF/YER057c/UK114 family)
MATEFFNPAGLSVPPGYTHVVTVEGGKLAFISGQTAYNANSELVGPGDLRAQTVQAFENLKIALAAVGATFEHVVKYTTFIVDYTPDVRPMLGEVRSMYLPKQNPPASTLLGVQALARDGMLIEIEAIARLD